MICGPGLSKEEKAAEEKSSSLPASWLHLQCEQMLTSCLMTSCCVALKSLSLTVCLSNSFLPWVVYLRDFVPTTRKVACHICKPQPNDSHHLVLINIFYPFLYNYHVHINCITLHDSYANFYLHNILFPQVIEILKLPFTYHFCHVLFKFFIE